MQKELENLLGVLPSGISDFLRKSEQYKSGSGINEIRIRADKHLALTYNGKNVLLPYRVSTDELSESLMALCKRSLYSYMDTIKEGYIPFSDSIRVGVCGRAVCEGPKIINVSNITSLNIRIPSAVKGAGRDLYRMLYDGDFRESVLVFSPPGAGKTTLLRDISLSLSCGERAKRVSVIDSRYELCDDYLIRSENIDLYAGYPKAKGIELAMRTMAPEYIICDEIGASEVDTLLSCYSMGVPLIVGAHARSIDELTKSGPAARLHSSGIFDLYVGIRVLPSGKRVLDITRRREIS